MNEKIKQKRKALKLTQAKLSELTGISQSEISQIENGKNFTVKYLTRICDILRLSLQDVVPFCKHVDKVDDCELWNDDKDNCLDCSNRLN